MSSDLRAAIERLLAQPATSDALANWAARENPEIVSPYESLYRVVMESWTQAPGRALAAARHAIAGADLSTLAPGDAGFLHHLDANTRLATGNAAEALAPYRLAWDAFRIAKRPDEAGRVAVGWSFACATTGNAKEAARVVARGRRVLPVSDVVGRARLASNLGTAWHLSGRLELARPEYRAAERTFHRAKQPAMAAACRYNAGLVETLEGRYATARKDLEAARATFRRLGVALHASYADVGLAELDLHQGHWDRGVESIRTLRDRFRELGDERATAWLQRELARLFTTIGARTAAAPEARAARRSFARLGLAPEAANVAFLEGRLALETGALADAFTRLREAEAHWDRAGNVRARARAGVEIARVRLAAGYPRAALEALAGPRRTLTRLDPRGDGAIARGVAARCLLAEGRARRALALAREAYGAARRHPANLERPRLAILVAEASGRAGDSPGAVRWARRAVQDLETLLARFGRRHLRALIGDAREPVYSTAVDLVLDHGGPRAATRAVDLLAQARSATLVEDLLQGRADRLSAESRAAIARLRDELLEGPAPDAEETRHRSFVSRIEGLEKRLESTPVRTPAFVRRAIERRRLVSWRHALGAREGVLFDRGGEGWRAFVIPPNGAVRCVPLPRAREALDRDGTSLRLTFEAAARLTASRRADFLERTKADCLESLDRLRRALWQPLGLEGTDVVVVPHDELHSIPLEAAAPDLVVTRIPHPALLRPLPARRAKRALLLRGSSPGTAPELAAVRRVLRRHDFDVRSGRNRRDLTENAGRLGVLHVAAHGTFHREGWLLSGLQLEDGWLGFEQLDRRRLEGALLHFTSCESGRTSALPGSDLEGWMTAGLAAGAREMILTLWKIDDDSALEFATEFYERWAAGASAAVARAVAGRVLAAKGRHPFRWAPFLAVG